MLRQLLLKLLLRVRGTQPGPLKRRFGSWMLRHFPGLLTCAEFESFIHDYYEDSLSSRVRHRFEIHMRLCPMCRVHFDSYIRAIALGQKVCERDDQLPEDMPDELVGAILLARSQEP